ncbi:T9SS type A sorting domain-containing protein [Tamlana sp. 2201CG12-4]|uniref:T9SS type A sorting domain-containing protein n=1 Tax=Tamlana sp. 2201CG12-4 TaxID=3112582 RepID=UPI002DBCB712|nr:T9SS type A sorting domain-containing protein [Tamlana sp. 2201CG12-4]MEC3908817.1 T9SS type A sorting domain-containing protein [Tamlana sp. 2201CG12-4]
MKKITLSLLFITTVISAQTTVQYNDFKKSYNTGSRGLIVEFVDDQGQSRDKLFQAVNDFPKDAGGTVLADNDDDDDGTDNDRYMDGVNAGTNYRNRILKLTGRVSNNNHAVEVWGVLKTLKWDYPSLTNKRLSFWAKQQNATSDGTDGPKFTLMYSTDYNNADTTDDDATLNSTDQVSAATWTPVPSAHITSGDFPEPDVNDDVYSQVTLDLSDAVYNSPSLTIAFKYEGSGVNTGGVHNGSFFISHAHFEGDGSLLSNEDVSVANTKLYPNPVNDVLNIAGVKNIKNTELFDVTGKKVYQGTTTNQIDVNNLPKGLYLLKIRSKEEGEAVRKIVID